MLPSIFFNSKSSDMFHEMPVVIDTLSSLWPTYPHACLFLHGDPNAKCTLSFVPFKSPGNFDLVTSQTHFLITPTPQKANLRLRNYDFTKSSDNSNHRPQAFWKQLADHAACVFSPERTMTNQRQSQESIDSVEAPLPLVCGTSYVKFGEHPR